MGEHTHDHGFHAAASCCGTAIASNITRRNFLSGVGGVALGSAVLAAGQEMPSGSAAEIPASDKALPPGKALRVKPVLLYHLPARKEKTSWRNYGGSISREGIEQEARRIDADLKALAAGADFPIEMMPVALVASPAEVAATAALECDLLLVHAQGGQQAWLEALTAAGKPTILYLRHRTQPPFYFWYETAHWWMLRKLTDQIQEPNLGLDDIVVDDYAEVLWRMRALYGLKNARGTKSIALGGLAPYSEPAAKNGPSHVKDVWGYEIQIVEMSDVEKRIVSARADTAVMEQARRQAERFAAQPGITLQTEPRFLVNTFVALKVFRDILRETGGTNIGVAQCMGQLIGLLDTTPCLVLSILNDEGLTAFCHTDYSHTAPGVLARWIAGKPPFLCNTHFPHDGLITLAHCAAPRRMNGRTCEPTKIMTHFESDYGAATKVEYAAGQEITTILPHVDCTKWQGFRGAVLDSPAYDACRSQMNVRIDGDWRRLQKEMGGFHAVVVYGNYLREIGYALGKLRIPWDCF